MLTAERLREVLRYDPETGVFTWRLKIAAKVVVGRRAGTISEYVVIRIAKRNYYAHVLAWLYMTGEWPDDQVDHHDRNKRNNAWLNLRPATNKQNHENIGTPSHNTSGHVGISWCKQTSRWLARITHNRRMRNLGRYVDFGAAVTARKAAEDQLFTHHV